MGPALCLSVSRDAEAAERRRKAADSRRSTASSVKQNSPSTARTTTSGSCCVGLPVADACTGAEQRFWKPAVGPAFCLFDAKLHHQHVRQRTRINGKDTPAVQGLPTMMRPVPIVMPELKKRKQKLGKATGSRNYNILKADKNTVNRLFSYPKPKKPKQPKKPKTKKTKNLGD